jgi:hypothetical protein
MLPTRVICYGKDEPLPRRTPLRAGPLSLVWEDGDLRNVKLGDIEIVRRIYVAIRDRNWGTVPPVMSNLAMEVGPDSFRIGFDVANRGGEIDFTWHGEITGDADGAIRFGMDGIAHSTFLRNRIGFCVLHPDNIAGARARVDHVDGTREEGRLPVFFVPDQPVLPFAEMSGMAHEVEPGVWAELRFAGDIFEMEDQRNWTDASYKTFCTPLRIPYPAEAPAGTRIVQSVTLALRDARATIPAAFGDAPREATFILDLERPPAPLPEIGLGVASHGAPLTERELALLRSLHPAHLRVDLVLSDPGYPARLRQAAQEAASLGASLEIALFVAPDHAAAELDGLGVAVDAAQPRVARWLIFPEREVFKGGTPLAEVLEPARAVLPGYGPAPILSGANTDFIFLARSVPPLDLVDGLTFAITPQVHAFDNASVVETLGTQGQAVASARAIAGELPVQVSPVTLKMRHNPYASGAIAPTPPGELPSQVDPRQMSLFLAGWTAASIKHIAENGASWITYFETTGWRGVMETADGSPVPDKFRSIAGGVFPVYHVLADVGEFRADGVLRSRSSDPLAFDGLALRRGDAVRVLLANLTAESQTVAVRGLLGEVVLRLLDATNAESAMRHPEAFRGAPPESRAVPTAGLLLDLPPYAVVRIDGSS